MNTEKKLLSLFTSDLNKERLSKDNLYVEDSIVYVNTSKHLAPFLSSNEITDKHNKFLENKFNNLDLDFTRSDAWEYLKEQGFEQDEEEVNTYNFDCDLCCIIQYMRFTLDDENYIMLQVHNGVDARCGYTHPVLFKTIDCEHNRLYMLPVVNIEEKDENGDWIESADSYLLDNKKYSISLFTYDSERNEIESSEIINYINKK